MIGNLLPILILFVLGIGRDVRAEIVKDPSLCGRTKCVVPSEQKFKYEKGVHYRYRHSVDISTNLGDAYNRNLEEEIRSDLRKRNESSLFIDSTVTIEFSSPCEGYLRITNASIRHDRENYNPEFPDRADAEFKSHLERYVLRFAFDDGEIREVCPDPNEAVWSLNLKRGILSMFQNTMKRFDVDRRIDELDINGICETRYRLREAKKTSLIIRKSKNLATCTHSGKHLSVVQSTFYTSPLSQTQRLDQPLLRSFSDCEITIDHNIYEMVSCKESHRLQPFSNGGKAGATTNTVATLRLIQESRDIEDRESVDYEEGNEEDNEDIQSEVVSKTKNLINARRTSLLYDHAASPRAVHGELRTSRDLLKNMCALGTIEELRQTFSEMYTKFIHSARLLDYPSMSQLLARANGICTGGRKHIIDALPFVGSNAAVKVMRDLIRRKLVDSETTNEWIVAFALIPRPDATTLLALMPLLEFQREIPEAQFILSYSAVVHAYCANHEHRCVGIGSKPIESFIDRMESTIEKGCAPRNHGLSEIKQTLEALKAIGNMGLETGTLSKRLKICVDDVGGFLPMEIRIAAIDAHRRLPSCPETRDRIFLNYYRNFSLDSEIRIASYLQVMRCPDYNVIKMIKHTLKEEEVNQVGSFVWSHLTNLLGSSSPTRIEIQSLLTDRDLGTKFNSDVRKFSRNFEKSFFSEEWNFGANYQSNLIFSTKSYVPRSATFNVTIDLFGESVNAFEISMRMEGMEYYVENIFGPNGPLSNDKVGDYFNKFLRTFRSAEQNDRDYWRRVKQLPNVIDNNFDDPRISVSYKIFGNELRFKMLNGDEEIKMNLASFDPWTKVKQILSGKEFHYENTVMFLDSSYVVPTTSGLPVRLDLSGSAAYNFKFSGLLNSDSPSLSRNAELEIAGNVTPSFSIDVTGRMIVDAFYKSAGLKLRSNVYSFGAVQLDLKIRGARLVRLSLDLPNRSMEVISIRTDVLLVSTNGAETIEERVGRLLTDERAEKKIVSVPENVISNTTCSWSSVERLIGLKLCADYQFPNVTKISNASYFILNGPTLFRVSVIKADPSAKNYLLEYKWDATPERSVIKLAFDTPGSRINRELSATVSFDPKNHNVTVLLRSAGNSLVAKGTYKRTEDEVTIDVGLDINGTKHLDASLGYARKRGTYGYAYTPKLYLSINSERIAELSGTVRNAQKNNISQCDIDLSFDTKKLKSRVLGYIMKRNNSLTGNVKLDYQIVKNSKKETLQIEISLINRSTKTLNHKEANLKLHSTAYPQLNVVISTWYQQALGHIELRAEVNAKPHLRDNRHKLTAQVVLTHSRAYFQSQEAKINAFVAITKPIQNLDIKVGVQHFAVGSASKTNLLIRYAPGKEISLAVNMVTPRGNMFAIEGHANLTIPNFNSMLIDARITERSRREYDLDFAGTWFSGHNITLRGTYADRSTAVTMSHGLKIILTSPSFGNSVLLNCKLYHDATDLKMALHLERIDLEKYALIIEHSMISSTKLISYAEGRYKNNVYTMTTNVDTEREIRMELHLDRWRDVHLIATSINEPEEKEFGIEIKWDANRDPALKFATLVQLKKFVDDPSISQNISGTITIAYPNRLVTGSCLFARRTKHNYIMDARIDWDPEKSIRLNIDTDHGIDSSSNSIKFESELITPFEHWKRTSLNAKYRQTENELDASGSAYWRDDQRVLVEFYGITQNTKDTFECHGNFGLTSTVHSIGRVTAKLSHKQASRRSVDTQLLINYEPNKTLELKSFWIIEKDRNNDCFNLTGNLQVASPVANYQKGEMKCQLRLMPNWRFYGASNLDLDKRKYSGVLKGDLARFKESMIEFNVTTPVERYAFLRGRFGLSEKNRHAVAEVASPSGPLGLEALCQLFTGASYDFHVKLQIATPIDALQKSLLVAKLNKKEADFRVAYNNITAGFQGVWHYVNFTDFHYSYVLFTPIHGLRESGIVAKILVNRMEAENQIDVDTEFSVRIVETKIGVKAHGGPKSPPPSIPMKNQLENGDSRDTARIDSSDFEEEDQDDNFYWKGDIEINAAIIAPIIGTMDIDKEGPTYGILARIALPQGKIIFDDRFTIEDVFDMKNILTIDTPFPWASQLTSNYVFNINTENSVYLMEISLNIRNRTNWIETGLLTNYSYIEGEDDDSRIHTVKLKVMTPLHYLKYIETKTIYEIDENIYKSRISIRTENTRADFFGSLEIERNFVDVSIAADVDGPVLCVPRTKITGKKDFTDKEKHLEFGINFATTEEKSAEFQASWQIENENYVKASLALETWIIPLRNIEAAIFYSNSISKNNSAELNLNLKHSPEQEYRFIGDYKNGSINFDIRSPIISHEHLNFHGNLANVSENLYKLNGDLKNVKTSEIYVVSSSLTIENNETSIISIDIKPDDRSSTIDKVILRIRKEKEEFTLTIENYNVNCSLSVNYVNSLNWEAMIEAEKRIGPGEMAKEKYKLDTFANVLENGNTTIHANALTPWKGIERFNVDGNVLLSNITGYLKLNNRLNNDTSYAILSWKLEYLTDMFGRIVAGINDKNVDARIFFKNPRKAFKNVDVGFDVDIDRERWRFATNATVGYRNEENFDAVVTVRLPPPDNDHHRLLASYHAKGGVRDANYAVGYNALKASTNYASDGSIRMASRDMDGHLRLTWGILPTQSINNIVNMNFDKKAVDLKYSLYTPKYENQETAILRLNYDANPEIYSLLDADLFYPAEKKIGAARISYSSLSNVNGTINATTPIPRLSYAGCNFVVSTTLNENKRFVEVFWPNDTALINSEYKYHSERLDSTLEGDLKLEIPLSTRHVGHATYGYTKKPQITRGHAELAYNKNKILNARYNSKGESRAGFERDRIEITIENSLKPIEIIYVNQYEYSGGNAGTNYPTIELKQINIYSTKNRSDFDIAGESRIKTSHDGQEIHLKAIHFNRTIQLKTDYEILPGEFDQNLWLSLAEDAWASYHINIVNKTTEDIDNQFIILNLAYPRRNFTFDGFYKITKIDLNSEAKLSWDETTEKPRTIGAAFMWKNSTNLDNNTTDRQIAVLSFKHPTFPKDVTFTGKLMKGDSKDLINTSLVVDYSSNPDKLFILSAALRDESEKTGDIKYSYKIKGKHVKTKLNLEAQGNIHKEMSVLFETDHRAKYKRSFLSEETGKLYGRIDAKNYQVKFHRESNELVKHFDIRYYPCDPAYIINGSIVNTPNLNATGDFYINIPEKLTRMMLNFTPDSTESLRMFGNIPDVRNAVFDIWRTYDQDFIVSDVSFYLRLNHSRLVTSKFKWRPELREDICNLVKTTIFDMYEELRKDAVYWKQYIKSETINSINEIWEDAKEDIEFFLDDWNDLRVLEEDFDDLKIYLNDSYNANDFYIKDFVAIGIYVIDELSLRSHIQSLPKIINEIWEIMGESGQAIRNSLLWIIETIKTGYQKISEIVGAILRGESVTQIANIVEKLIEKYDMFMKDLHVSFIKYIQNLWNKFSEAMSRQWNETLKMMEPIFIRVLHYLEAVLWKVSKEVVDFLYDRKKEIIGSPYFDRFTNLTQDVDRIYRDIKANDIVTNIQKYSGLIIQFIRERYFTIVPFGKELKDLVDEIVSEIKELTKLPTIQYAIDKVNQVYEKAKYFYEYFGVRGKIENAVRVAHAKIIDISQTALQAESRYREAKTKFIFDPNEGLVCLEQKLPMSWHAFNQTPEFQEIPEYRAIVDTKTYFSTSNTTFWTLYYQYKPYTEPSNWLPPFKAQAMIIGPQRFVSFDGRHFDFAGSCTYLLAHDFVRNSFAVLIAYDRQPNTDRITHRIIVLIGRNAIELDIFKDTVKLLDTGAILRLPVELENGTAFVYQEDNIVTVEQKQEQFKLRCNLKFDLCILDLSGYYYGRTAGLLGTMNNEPMDDTLTSTNVITKNIEEFAHSWSINVNQCTNSHNFAITKKKNAPIRELCDSLFVNKSSEFSGCFNVVSPNRYADNCAIAINDEEICTIAMSYMQTCSFYDSYLRIPDKCTTCPMIDGTNVPEGEIRKLDGEKVPRTTDVVFIVEAKDCNRNIRQNRSIDQLISQMNKELNSQSLINNRWSLVIFGGDGVYDRPRSLILDGQIFTQDSSRFVDYFSNIPVGHGNQDVFGAIGFASQLVFRAGVSKTFVLMPCSHCEPENQTLDYSVLHQVLLEHDITLHILMDGDFHFKKQRVNKMFYGLDAHRSYTRKDTKSLIGDVDLRRQAKLSKSALGYCAPLSLETNGTIFSGNKLRFEKMAAIKKFASVFSQRIALTAQPSGCQRCECTADNDGITHMECMPCVYPMAVEVDYASETFDEDDALSGLEQPLDVDYGQIDTEDE